MTTDAVLAVRCQLGEVEAFDQLVERFHPALCRYARRLTGGDDAASDAVQDIWVRVVRSLPRLREPERLRAWIFSIAHRTLMDRLRHRYSDREVTGLDVGEHAAEPEDLTAEEQSVAVHAALESMPLIEREILTLFYLRELSLSEISAALDLPIGTAKSRLFRARKLLHTRMTTETHE
jgi:RNA polymerase sigma-70 factor (ECF subfamily)